MTRRTFLASSTSPGPLANACRPCLPVGGPGVGTVRWRASLVHAGREGHGLPSGLAQVLVITGVPRRSWAGSTGSSSCPPNRWHTRAAHPRPTVKPHPRVFTLVPMIIVPGWANEIHVPTALASDEVLGVSRARIDHRHGREQIMSWEDFGDAWERCASGDRRGHGGGWSQERRPLLLTRVAPLHSRPDPSRVALIGSRRVRVRRSSALIACGGSVVGLSPASFSFFLTAPLKLDAVHRGPAGDVSEPPRGRGISARLQEVHPLVPHRPRLLLAGGRAVRHAVLCDTGFVALDPPLVPQCHASLRSRDRLHVRVARTVSPPPSLRVRRRRVAHPGVALRRGRPRALTAPPSVRCCGLGAPLRRASVLPPGGADTRHAPGAHRQDRRVLHPAGTSRPTSHEPQGLRAYPNGAPTMAVRSPGPAATGLRRAAPPWETRRPHPPRERVSPCVLRLVRALVSVGDAAGTGRIACDWSDIVRLLSALPGPGVLRVVPSRHLFRGSPTVSERTESPK
jgi:hypothetical protein